MPRQILMTFDKKQARWKKMYKGKMFVVSCHALNAPATKLDSMEAANGWWISKRAEIDGGTAPGSDKARLEVIERFAGRPITSDEERDQVEREMATTFIAKPELASKALDGWLSDAAIARVHAGFKHAISPLADDSTGTVGTHFTKWKTIQLSLGTSAARKKMNIFMASMFVDFIGEHAPLNAIDENSWEAFWHHIAAYPHQSGYKRRILATARIVVEYLAEKGLIQLPRNLKSKSLVFKNHVTAPKPKDIPTIQRFLKALDGENQNKLHALLMLNCGMLPKDISDLTQTEVDWTNGTITRKRSKLKDQAAPTVTYKLWPITFKLLKRHRSNHPTLALVTKSGSPWVVNEINADGSKYKNSNSIASNFRNAIADEKGLKVSPKDLRTTGSSLLAQHEQYKFYALHYLADSPKGTANKNYVVPSQEEFDRAIEWMATKIL